MKQTLRRRIIVMSLVVGTIGVGLILHVMIGLTVPAFIGSIFLVALLANMAINIPARHRRHSWGQVEQAVDNSNAQFEKSYPEESVGEVPVRKAGRNDPCPCGSGQKFKRCCAG